MNSNEAPLTVRQGVVIASRALCILLLFNAALSLTSFPAMIASLLHEWNSMPGFAAASQNNYVYGIYIREIAVAILRLALELFIAWWFYRCGPGAAKFLLGESGDAEEENSEPPEQQAD